MSPEQVADLRARLEQTKAELENSGPSFQQAARSAKADKCAMDRSARMEALQSREMAAAAESHRRVRLSEIAAALQRMAADRYGYCAACGTEMDIRRLRSDPTATLCMDCVRGQ